MNLAVLSESPADEAALRILVEAILGQPTSATDLNKFRTRHGGVGETIKILPVVLLHLHYHTTAEGLVVAVDSDYSSAHMEAHERPGRADPNCRRCQLHQIVGNTQNKLNPRPDRKPLQLAIGLATPCIEAWYVCGVDPHVSEVAWINALQSKKFPYDSKRLKRDVYGNDRPSLPLETLRAKEEATRLAQNISELEKWFPGGFGALARDVRNWQ